MMNARFSFCTCLAVPCVIVAALWFPRAHQFGPVVEGAHKVGTVLGVALCVVGVTAGALRSQYRLAVPTVVFCATVLGWVLGLTEDPFILFSWSVIPLAAEHWRILHRCLPAVWLAVTVTFLVAVDGARALPATPLAATSVFVALIIAEAKGRQRHCQAREAEMDFARYTASELHDGIGHSLSVIRAEAGLGLMASVGAHENKARDSLTRIEKQAASAYEALARIVETYSNEQKNPQVDELTVRDVLAADRAAGLAISVQGPVPDHPALVRIVQEMLRNARQHSADASCVLDFQQNNGASIVRCVNSVSVPPISEHGQGHGLNNIARRARVAGGDAEWGIDDAVFWVEARVLPKTLLPAGRKTPA